MRSRFLMTVIVASLASAGGPVGCTPGPAKVAAPEPVTIPVSLPVEREVTDYVEFTGRTNAVESVDIRPGSPGISSRSPSRRGRT